MSHDMIIFLSRLVSAIQAVTASTAGLIIVNNCHDVLSDR